MASPTITYQQLADAGACPKGLRSFRSNFGDSVEIDPAKADQWSGPFDLDWTLANLIPEGGHASINSAVEPHHQARKSASAANNAAYLATIDAAYSGHDPADYEGHRESAWSVYTAAEDAAETQLQRGKARALAAALLTPPPA